MRSGQHIIWPDGDVVILGAVSSGAEVTAGGSVHIYGALRGAPLRGSGAMRMHGYLHAALPPSLWPLTDSTLRRKKWMQNAQTNPRKFCSRGRLWHSNPYPDAGLQKTSDKNRVNVTL